MIWYVLTAPKLGKLILAALATLLCISENTSVVTHTTGTVWDEILIQLINHDSYWAFHQLGGYIHYTVKGDIASTFLWLYYCRGRAALRQRKGPSAPINCPRHVCIHFRQTVLRSQAVVFSSIFIFHLLAQPLQPLCFLVIGEIDKYRLRALERKGLSCCRHLRMSEQCKPSLQFTYCSGLL